MLVVTGELTLTDNHCNVTTYSQGQGFATGLDTHLAVAGPDGADFYSLYFLTRRTTTDLQTPPESGSPPPTAPGKTSPHKRLSKLEQQARFHNPRSLCVSSARAHPERPDVSGGNEASLCQEGLRVGV